jgi:phospholipid/cholesterol/gamma-HCH transport system substrate-binding protein
MPRRTSWNELALGLAGLITIAIIAFGVLFFAPIGTLHGDTFRLFAVTDQARGVIRGTEVWLAGQKVGVVKDVTFLPPTYPANGRVLVSMDVLSSARDKIRLNSTAQVRSGGTLIAAPVVYVTIGTAAMRAVVPGDTIHALPQPDLETMTSEFAVASRQFPAIIDNIKILNNQLHSVDNTLGALGIEHGGTELARARAGAARLSSQISTPTGTVGLALSSGSVLTARARQAMARADSIRTLLSSDRTSYGRFRRDSTLLRDMANLRAEIDTVRAQMTSPNGTLGRMRADSALFQALNGAEHEMTLIMADVHRRPLRYIHF